MSFLNLLTLLFVGAKLFDAIDWSWWVVLSPTLLNVVVVLGFIVFAAVKGKR